MPSAHAKHACGWASQGRAHRHVSLGAPRSERLQTAGAPACRRFRSDGRGWRGWPWRPAGRGQHGPWISGHHRCVCVGGGGGQLAAVLPEGRRGGGAERGRGQRQRAVRRYPLGRAGERLAAHCHTPTMLLSAGMGSDLGSLGMGGSSLGGGLGGSSMGSGLGGSSMGSGSLGSGLGGSGLGGAGMGSMALGTPLSGGRRGPGLDGVCCPVAPRAGRPCLHAFVSPAVGGAGERTTRGRPCCQLPVGHRERCTPAAADLAGGAADCRWQRQHGQRHDGASGPGLGRFRGRPAQRPAAGSCGGWRCPAALSGGSSTAERGKRAVAAATEAMIAVAASAVPSTSNYHRGSSSRSSSRCSGRASGSGSPSQSWGLVAVQAALGCPSRHEEM